MISSTWLSFDLVRAYKLESAGIAGFAAIACPRVLSAGFSTSVLMMSLFMFHSFVGPVDLVIPVESPYRGKVKSVATLLILLEKGADF